jgi:transposase
VCARRSYAGVQDIKCGLTFHTRHIAQMRRAAREMIAANTELEERFQLLTAAPGIGEISATQLLAETVLLPPELTVRQWVAHSGLDPAHHDRVLRYIIDRTSAGREIAT